MLEWSIFLGGLLVAWVLANGTEWDWAALLVFLATVIFGVKSCSGSEWNKQAEAQYAARQAADAQPRVIREVDGCKVYTFKAGDRWHYFTRCPAQVTTESSWTEYCGKGCTSTKTETIVTQPK